MAPVVEHMTCDEQFMDLNPNRVVSGVHKASNLNCSYALKKHSVVMLAQWRYSATPNKSADLSFSPSCGSQAAEFLQLGKHYINNIEKVVYENHTKEILLRKLTKSVS